ncbi:MAG: gliding motility-associated C-terminal domain-containing protein [Chitinophagaceae bacterium]
MIRLLIILAFSIGSALHLHAQTPRLEWVKTIGPPASGASGASLLIDSNKTLVVTGQFNGTADFDAGPGTFTLSTTGVSDIFFTRYDTSGSFIWAKKLGGTQDDYIRDIKLDREGNLMVLCLLQGIVDLDPGPGVVNSTGSAAFLLKLDNNGNLVWHRQLSSGDYYNVEIDNAGNILLSGYFSGTRDFDPGPGVYPATSLNQFGDFFIVKLDNTGSFTWMKQMNNLGLNFSHQDDALETDASGNIYLGGYYNGSFDVDPGAPQFILPSSGGLDAFVVKLTPDGNFVWGKIWGGPTGNDQLSDLTVDAPGNVFITGRFTQTADFDPGPGSYLLSPTAGYSCFITKLNTQGNFVFAKHFAGQSTGQCITLDFSGNIYISGAFHGNTDFDPGPAVYNLYPGHLYTAKLLPDGSFGWVAGFMVPDLLFFEGSVSAVAVDTFRNVYYTSSFPYITDFDPGPGVQNITPQGWNAPIVKLSQCQSLNNISATFCNSYTLNNVTYTDTGTFYQVLPLSAACDSIIILHLTREYRYSQFTASACNFYKWNDDSLTVSGIYKDTIRLPNGCDSIVELHLTVRRSPGAVDLGPDKNICPGNTIALNAKRGYVSYLWQDNSTDSVFIASAPGTYHVQTNDSCGNIFRDTVVITAAPSIPFSIGPDRTKCNNDTLRLLAPPGFLNYTWANNYNISSLSGQQVIVNPIVDTVYYVKAEKTTGCFAYDTIIINVNHSPGINLGNDTSFCEGQSVQLNAGGGFSTYVWNTSADSQTITVSTAGKFSIIATTAEGCSSFDTLSVISIYQNPQVILDGNNELCAGTTRMLDAGNFSSYLWQDGSTRRTLTVSGIGDYSVRVWDNNGCTGTGSTSITNILPLPAAFLPKDTSLCSYSTLQLVPAKDFSQYLWNNNSSTRSIIINKAGLYWLQVTDDKGCAGKDSILILPKECRRGLFVPNAFSPDNNRVNDDFKALLYGPVKFFELTIYNRWGQVVFKTTDRFKGWDGSFKGIKQDSNVFVWICKYQFEGEEMKMEKGSVVLIR